MSFRFHVLGGVELTGIGQADARAVVTQPKRLALLAWLLLAEPRGFQRRDSLLALFWPDLGMEEARRALRQSLHFLRQHLGADALVNRGAEEVAASPETVQCDALEFRTLVREGKDEEALAWYRGDLLPGFHVDGAAPEFEEWLDQARTGLRREALAAMRRVVEACAAEGRLADAGQWAQRALALPAAEERDLVRAMQLLRDAGEAAAARELYDTHARRLKSQFGDEPGPAARALRLELRSPSAVALPVPGPPAPMAPPPPAPGVAPPEGPPFVSPARRRRWWPVVVTAAAVSAAIIGWRITGVRPAASVAEPAPPRVAVAVFVNQTGDSTLEPLGTMVSDWVMRGLTRVTGLQVVDVGALYASGRSATGVPRDARAVAEENGATLAVAGTFYRAGRDSLAFSARVLDVASGNVLRQMDSVRAARSDPLAGAAELRDRLTSALGSIVNPQAILLTGPALAPPRYEAFQEYVRGQEAYWSGRFDEALPLIQRAAMLDPGFAGARVFSTVLAAGVGRCGLVDSMARSLEPSLSRLPELERTTLAISQARCRTDWLEALRLQQRRMELLPGAGYVRWGAAVAARQANRPATALAILEELDPAHGLGWLGPTGASFFWREVTASLHMLGEYQRERQVADSLLQAGQVPLTAVYARARSLAALGLTDDLAAALSGVGGLSPDPALEAGQIPGQFRPALVATPGWVLYQAGAELAAHGQPAAARALATRAIEWFTSADRGTPMPAEHRWVLGRSYLLAERSGEARREFAALAGTAPSSVDYRGLLGVAAARLGDRAAAEEALRILEAATGISPPGLPAYYRAAILAALNDLPAAMDLLEGLPGGSHPYHILDFHSDPILAPLRGSARFQRILVPRG